MFSAFCVFVGCFCSVMFQVCGLLFLASMMFVLLVLDFPWDFWRFTLIL